MDQHIKIEDELGEIHLVHIAYKDELLGCLQFKDKEVMKRFIANFKKLDEDNPNEIKDWGFMLLEFGK
jgi:hypothetical protein